MGQVQPFPVAVVGVNPVGSASATVTVPLVAAAPLFDTVSVKPPVAPRWNVPALAVFEIVRSDAGAVVFTVAVEELLAGVVSPPPLTVALFVNDAAAFEATFTPIVIDG